MFCILRWTFGPVEPSPATHAILTVLKGGRKRVEDVLLAKTVFDAFRGAQPLFHALFGVKILSGTLLDIAFNETRVTGLG